MYIKMKHRVAFMLMVVAMMIVTLVVCTSAANEKFEMSVELTDSTGASMADGAIVTKNDEFTVTVKIDKNPGVAGIGFDIKYDESVIELVSKDPTFVKDFTSVDDESYTLVYGKGAIRYNFMSFFKAVNETGDLLSFKFKVVSASETTTESAITLVPNDGGIFDDDLADLESSVTNTSVTLHNKHNIKVNDAIPATCYSEGFSKEEVCLDCGEVITPRTSTGYLEHNWVVTTPAVPATCTAAGTTEGKKCTNAGCTEVIVPIEEKIKPHNLVSVAAKNPSCTEIGWTAHSKCQNEGCTYKEGYVEKDPLNHVGMIVDVAGKEPTATETGLTAGKQCYNCQTWIQAQEVIPALGHVYTTDFIIDVEPTCTTAGSKSKHCTLAGCTEKTEVTEIPALGHDLTDFIIDVEATCTTAGSKHKECSRCPEKFEVTEIPALGHTVVVDKKVEPTYSNTGLTEGQHCSVCGTVLVEQQEIAKLFPWFVIVIVVAVVAVVAVVVVYFTVIKKKNYRDDMYDDDDDDDEQ